MYLVFIVCRFLLDRKLAEHFNWVGFISVLSDYTINCQLEKLQVCLNWWDCWIIYHIKTFRVRKSSNHLDEFSFCFFLLMEGVQGLQQQEQENQSKKWGKKEAKLTINKIVSEKTYGEGKNNHKHKHRTHKDTECWLSDTICTK